jgi:hypothetical protein
MASHHVAFGDRLEVSGEPVEFDLHVGFQRSLTQKK